MTTWNARFFPLIAVAALVGCGPSNNKGGATDTDSDTTTTDTDTTTGGNDTGHTGSSGFNPDALQYDAAFAVDDAGAVHAYTDASGNSVPAFFEIILTTQRNVNSTSTTLPDPECVYRFAIHADAFGYIGAGSDTDTAAASSAPADLITWLQGNGLYFGFVVKPGMYDFQASSDCDKISGGAPTQADVEKNLLSGPTYVGFNTAVDDTTWTTYQQSGIDRSKLLGGLVKYGFQYTDQNGGKTDTASIAGIFASVDDNWVPQLGSGSTITVNDAASAWTTKPAKGWYEALFPLYFQLSNGG